MTELIGKMIGRYGAVMTVIHNGAESETRGFIQPVTREAADESAAMGPLGAVDRRCLRYIGRAETPVEPGDTIVYNGARWHVHDAAAEMFGAEISHYWAILMREVEE